MRLVETSKFRKLRKKIRGDHERSGLREAVHAVSIDPGAGKTLKGEFKDLRALKYQVKGQSRRLIYKAEKNTLILFSFGPREGIYG